MHDESSQSQVEQLEVGLRRLQDDLPGSLRYRFQNALDQFEKSAILFPIDREMASFRAITGEEEAATALMECLRLRGYTYANKFERHNHQHKAGVMACVLAIANTVRPMLREFQLVFDYERRRIDLKIPLANLGVVGADGYVIQFVEPLGLVHHRGGIAESRLFDEALNSLAENTQSDGINRLVRDRANSRTSCSTHRMGVFL